jgi:hypothetical protein
MLGESIGHPLFLAIEAFLDEEVLVNYTAYEAY